MDRDNDIAHISGNAPPEVKRLLGTPHTFFANQVPEIKGPIFGESIARRLVVTEVSVERKEAEPLKKEGRVVLEITVEEDMTNGIGNVHGGCSAFLIDICSTMALTALSLSSSTGRYISVSQSLNIVYHSPASLGDRLRLINTTMTLGGRAHSARTEVWNLTHHRLVSSGVHIKMQPTPKANL